MAEQEDSKLGQNKHVCSILFTKLIDNLLSPFLPFKIDVHSLILSLGDPLGAPVENDIEHNESV